MGIGRAPGAESPASIDVRLHHRQETQALRAGEQKDKQNPDWRQHNVPSFGAAKSQSVTKPEKQQAAVWKELYSV